MGDSNPEAASAGYSEVVHDHLRHPRNEGPLLRPDAVGVQANPICGDTVKLMLRIADGRVVEARWQTVGCEPARALSSLATELVLGRTLDTVGALGREQLLQACGGLPAGKEHAAALAAGALVKAVAAYRKHSDD